MSTNGTHVADNQALGHILQEVAQDPRGKEIILKMAQSTSREDARAHLEQFRTLVAYRALGMTIDSEVLEKKMDSTMVTHEAIMRVRLLDPPPMSATSSPEEVIAQLNRLNYSLRADIAAAKNRIADSEIRLVEYAKANEEYHTWQEAMQTQLAQARNNEAKSLGERENAVKESRTIKALNLELEQQRVEVTNRLAASQAELMGAREDFAKLNSQHKHLLEKANKRISYYQEESNKRKAHADALEQTVRHLAAIHAAFNSHMQSVHPDEPNIAIQMGQVPEFQRAQAQARAYGSPAQNPQTLVPLNTGGVVQAYMPPSNRQSSGMQIDSPAHRQSISLPQHQFYPPQPQFAPQQQQHQLQLQQQQQLQLQEQQQQQQQHSPQAYPQPQQAHPTPQSPLSTTPAHIAHITPPPPPLPPQLPPQPQAQPQAQTKTQPEGNTSTPEQPHRDSSPRPVLVKTGDQHVLVKSEDATMPITPGMHNLLCHAFDPVEATAERPGMWYVCTFCRVKKSEMVHVPNSTDEMIRHISTGHPKMYERANAMAA